MLMITGTRGNEFFGRGPFFQPGGLAFPPSAGPSGTLNGQGAGAGGVMFEEAEDQEGGADRNDHREEVSDGILLICRKCLVLVNSCNRNLLHAVRGV